MTNNNDTDCIKLNGSGPIGEICRNCKFARGITYKDKEIFVCDLLDGLNISPDYRACFKFELI